MHGSGGRYNKWPPPNRYSNYHPYPQHPSSSSHHRDRPRQSDSHGHDLAHLQTRLDRLRQEQKQAMLNHEEEMKVKDDLLRQGAKELEALEQRCETLERAANPESQRVKDHKIRELEARCLALGAQVEEKESEMRSLKTLLSTQNEVSDADVLQAVDHINNLIEQLTSHNTERWLESLPDFSPSNEQSEEIPSLVQMALGSDFLDMLRNTPALAQYASLLLQYAWQAMLVDISYRILDKFHFSYPNSDGTRAIDELATGMAQNGKFFTFHCCHEG